MTIELTLTSNTFLDLAFGKVIKGKEMQVFEEYFPAITPVLEECGIQPLCSYAILATNISGRVPDQGALTRVPSTESFARFHKDSRFIEVRPLRDDAMEFLTDGNFFTSLDKVVTLDTDADYAVIIADGNPLKTDPVLDLSLAENSPAQRYSGRSMTIHSWSSDAEQLMNHSSDKAVVFRIRFTPS